MTLHPSIVAEGQRPTTDAIVSLFKLDATFAGAGVYYFCQAAEESEPVYFGGQAYTPVDVQFEGLETSGTGTMPAPKVRVRNNNGMFQTMLNTYGDLAGCTLQRARTYRRFLDNGSSPDPTAYYGPDTFRVERKSVEEAAYIEWELSSILDQEGAMIPGRVVIRDVCSWRYRVWNGTSFDYSKAMCQYVGSDMYDIYGNAVTDGAKDKCGRHLADCELRFGKSNPLPFGGFPGVSRVR